MVKRIVHNSTLKTFQLTDELNKVVLMLTSGAVLSFKARRASASVVVQTV